jgi:hypothetical protein
MTADTLVPFSPVSSNPSKQFWQALGLAFGIVILILTLFFLIMQFPGS